MHWLKQRILDVLNAYCHFVCRSEWESQTFKRFNERPVEYAFVLSIISKIYPRRVLDVGSGTTALPHILRSCGSLVTATDNIRDYWPSGMVNRHYHVIHDDITTTKLTTCYDLVTCISVLEHIREVDAAVRNMASLLTPGGHLALTFPYNEADYCPNVYALPGSSYGQSAPYVTQSYSRTNLDRWTLNTGLAIVQQQYWRFWSGDFWTVGHQIIPPQAVGPDDRHQLTCVLLRAPTKWRKTV